jgi:hypothetical protein
MPSDDIGKFNVGDIVKLLSVPDWLVADLPEAERAAILACVGKEMVISDIDQFGGIWLGFGQTAVDGNDAVYSGQTFITEADRILLVRSMSR